MGASQRRKGANGERELAGLLSDAFGQVVQRKLGQARDSGDDIELQPFRIECKRRERIAVAAFMEQAVDSLGPLGGEIPIVAMREDGGEWLVMMRLADWTKLAREEIATEKTVPKNPMEPFQES